VASQGRAGWKAGLKRAEKAGFDTPPMESPSNRLATAYAKSGVENGGSCLGTTEREQAGRG
jgi:hypothetical protein